MLTLSLVSLLIGAILGMRFKILILLPAIFSAFVMILAGGISSSAAPSFVALATLLAATCLQLGYLIGSAGRYAIAAMRAGWLQRIWQRAASVG